MVNRKYVAQRLALMVMSAFLVVTLLFFLFRQVPGGPVGALAPAGLPENVRQRLIENYGLNQPLWKQYLLYMWNLVQLNLGHSFFHNQSVSTVLIPRLLNTLSMMLSAVIFSYVVGIYLGTQLAWLRGQRIERLGMVIVLIARSTPVFWTGLILLYVFSFQFDLFPIGGMRSIDATYSGPVEKFLSLDFLYHLALPMVSLSLYYIGLPLLLMRNNMLEVLTQDYINTAMAKGLSDRRVMFNHAARNAILPVVTAFAVAVGFSVGGQVLIEQVFSWPGLGKEMVQAAARNDYPMAQAAFLTLAVIVLVMNFIADLTYTYLDPRVRLGGHDE